MLVTIDDIRHAAASVDGVVLRTPVVGSAARPDLLLKAESLQPTGAFKVRGAVHAIASLPADARAAGVVTHSSGNHGQALAWAARRAGIPCVVVIPDGAPPVKIEAVRRLGATVELVPAAQREVRAHQVAEERGMTLVPPYDHPHIVAGQGTVGLEILVDVPSPAAVLVPIGGGGLASGVATAVKALAPATRVIGVEPELAADSAESLAAGQRVTWPVEQTGRTVADGLRTALSDLTYAHLSAYLDGIVTVTEVEILSTVGSLAREYRLVAEPSGAVAPAAWLHHAASLRDRFGIGDGPIVAVVSGGNLDPALLATALVG
ncbi:MAG: threonine/serine dehydratase [Micromonosporaceae bacterium]|nr:threonine/serine dehydratase [Micromonosporaceae bacterium]